MTTAVPTKTSLPFELAAQATALEAGVHDWMRLTRCVDLKRTAQQLETASSTMCQRLTKACAVLDKSDAASYFCDLTVPEGLLVRASEQACPLDVRAAVTRGVERACATAAQTTAAAAGKTKHSWAMANFAFPVASSDLHYHVLHMETPSAPDTFYAHLPVVERHRARLANELSTRVAAWCSTTMVECNDGSTKSTDEQERKSDSPTSLSSSPATVTFHDDEDNNASGRSSSNSDDNDVRTQSSRVRRVYIVAFCERVLNDTLVLDLGMGVELV